MCKSLTSESVTPVADRIFSKSSAAANRAFLFFRMVPFGCWGSLRRSSVRNGTWSFCDCWKEANKATLLAQGGAAKPCLALGRMGEG